MMPNILRQLLRPLQWIRHSCQRFNFFSNDSLLSRVLPTRPQPFRHSQSSPQGCCSFSLGLRSSPPATRVPFMAFPSVLRLSFPLAASLFVVETLLKDMTFFCCVDHLHGFLFWFLCTLVATSRAHDPLQRASLPPSIGSSRNTAFLICTLPFRLPRCSTSHKQEESTHL